MQVDKKAVAAGYEPRCNGLHPELYSEKASHVALLYQFIGNCKKLVVPFLAETLDERLF